MKLFHVFGFAALQQLPDAAEQRNVVPSGRNKVLDGLLESAGDLKLFADLMMMAPDKLIYSAVDALMYPSYTLGAHGSIAAILSAAPHASVRLWDAVKAGDHVLALELHKKLLTLW